MNFLRQTSQTLHDEHRANLDLLGRVEQALGRGWRRGADPGVEVARLMGELARQLEQDTGRHFDFEERELFSRLTDAGEGDIAGLLADEHDAIREVAAEVLPLARSAASGQLDDAGWEELRRGAFELTERQVAHIQKETMALLPMVEDLLDDDTDRQLALAYAEG
jgi:hemerythrin-like domain-containing protein